MNSHGPSLGGENSRRDRVAAVQRASPDTSRSEVGQVGTKSVPSGMIHGVSVDAASAYTWPSDLPDGCPSTRRSDGRWQLLSTRKE